LQHSDTLDARAWRARILNVAAPQRVLSRDQLLGLSRQPPQAKAELIRTERGAGYVFTAVVEIVR
jgi:hypothetical protein